MIKVDITKRIKIYSGWVDLKVETDFQMGAVTCISGASGAGKTTLLQMIAGFINPEHGTIQVNQDIWFDAERKISKKIQERNIGFVFQDYALFPNMTVYEQLKYGTSDEIYITELLQIGEMESFRKNYPSQLSGGQQQRLAILRAMSTKPDLLLMDEPFSAMDQDLKNKLLPKLYALFLAQRTTVLLVTHDLHDIDQDTIVFRLAD